MTITLIHGDARRHMRKLKGQIDTIITDPIWPNAPADMFPDVTDAQQLLKDVLRHVDAKRLIIILRFDSDPRFLQAVPKRYPFFRTQILPYAIPGYIGRKLGGDELAYCFGEPLPSAPGRRVIPGYAPKAQTDERKNNGHPCSRTPIHMRWLVNWWSLPGEVVCDPFMGSGTIGVACVELQRNFIGIEIDEGYYAIAQRQLAAAAANPPLPLDIEPALIQSSIEARES